MNTNSAQDFNLADRIESGLKKCIGKRKACKTSLMISRLRQEGFKVNGAKIRELIHYLRTERKLFICGDNHGYYMPATTDERRHQINSMSSRIREITEARDKMLLGEKDIIMKSQKIMFEA